MFKILSFSGILDVWILVFVLLDDKPCFKALCIDNANVFQTITFQ